MATSRKAFLLRLDFQVYEEIRRLAASELRSVNGQIEYLIRQALRDRGRTEGGKAVDDGGRRAPERERSETEQGG